VFHRRAATLFLHILNRLEADRTDRDPCYRDERQWHKTCDVRGSILVDLSI
jgi:hypothetical protein